MYNNIRTIRGQTEIEFETIQHSTFTIQAKYLTTNQRIQRQNNKNKQK